jgi:hypothetical protein
VPGGSPVLSDAELDAIEAFVRDGGGLIVLGEEEHDKYEGCRGGALLAGMLRGVGADIRRPGAKVLTENSSAPELPFGPDPRSRHGANVFAQGTFAPRPRR